ncbi:ABC-F family ATP-binding cassette domain-containing protein [Nocardia sp. NPDC050710]|uniref:ABC-F family ATP-binding cassette domain-containing protein n=1 Tax=Nocardia sp. NPDC050710 TaxID=3157220 RepID=UPI0033C63945
MEFGLTTQLTLRGVSKSYAERTVLDHVTLSIRPGERAGIVGENGSGKSTVLRIMAGLDAPDDGVVTRSAPGGFGHLAQTLAGRTVADTIDLALAELRDIERRMQAAAEAEDMAAYGELLTAFEARDGYGAETRVDKSMHGLGLADIARNRPLSSLSGGEQARLGLACLLAASPEVLLLDEPTNHLDESALTWLEDRLRSHHETVVVVSHDRTFLDRVATAIIEVDDGGVTRFGGGYSGFRAAKAAARQRWEQAYAQWREEIERLEEFSETTAHRVAAGRAMKDNNKMAYDRNAGRVQNSVSSRVRQSAERLRRLRADPVPEPPKPLRFTGRFGTGGGPGSFEVGSLTLGPRDRLLIHGPNGAGKSTLLDKIYASARGRVGYLRQDIALDPEQTVAQVYGYGRAALMSTGLFHRDALDLRMGALSEGQRRRLAVARLLAEEYDLLLLDEPTNHLSLTLVEELESALRDYAGALVVVTHDRALRGRFRGMQREVEQIG